MEYNKHLDHYNNVSTNSNELNVGHIPKRMNENHTRPTNFRVGNMSSSFQTNNGKSSGPDIISAERIKRAYNILLNRTSQLYSITFLILNQSHQYLKAETRAMQTIIVE